VNHRETRVVAIIVHAADVDEIIEPGFLFRESAHMGDLPGVENLQSDFAAKLGGFSQQTAEAGLEFLNEFQSGHGVVSGTKPVQVRSQTATLSGAPARGSLATLACNLSNPSRRASGRGGQPATYTSTGRM